MHTQRSKAKLLCAAILVVAVAAGIASNVPAGADVSTTATTKTQAAPTPTPEPFRTVTTFTSTLVDVTGKPIGKPQTTTGPLAQPSILWGTKSASGCRTVTVTAERQATASRVMVAKATSLIKWCWGLATILSGVHTDYEIHTGWGWHLDGEEHHIGWRFFYKYCCNLIRSGFTVKREWDFHSDFCVSFVCDRAAVYIRINIHSDGTWTLDTHTEGTPS